MDLGEEGIKIIGNINFDEKQKNNRINTFDSQKKGFLKIKKKQSQHSSKRLKIRKNLSNKY